MRVITPYNAVRDYPGYNSKLGYNSNFLCLEYEGIVNVGFLPPYNSKYRKAATCKGLQF